MKFTERSFYADSGLRPRPYIYHNDKDNIVIVVTNWAQKIEPMKIVQTIENYLLSSGVDDEVTSPFVAIPFLGKSANNLRTSLLLLNNQIYKEHNQEELTSGLEVFVGFKRDDEFVFGHVGQPNILLSKKDKNILPIYQNIDLSLDLSKKEMLPPVPSKLLGIDSQIEIEIQSLKPQKNDKLLLLSYSWIPKEILTLTESKRSFEHISKTLANVDSQSFWLGLIEF